MNDAINQPFLLDARSAPTKDPSAHRLCNEAIRINQASSLRQVPLSFKNVINASYWSCGMSLILMK